MFPQHASGAFTGETAGSMLRDVGCEFVIVGHSERRALMGETSKTVALKFKAALDIGLKPILCVGETLEQRESGQTKTVIDEQMNAVLDEVGIDVFRTRLLRTSPYGRSARG